ncbi:MAG: tetrahydrofolate dehydrogenase/cyclohydrolase catalytic domain-containing protein [Bacillota bacterium]
MQINDKVIDGRRLSEAVKDGIVKEILEEGGTRRPSLAIILVGERADSKLYVSLKEREAKKVGIDTHLYVLEEEMREDELLEVINFLNTDVTVDAILLQLPLPSHMDADKMIAAIDPLKDADGFHPLHPEYVLSPVIAAVDYIVKEYKLSGKACIFHRSDVFGSALKEHLEGMGFSVGSRAVLPDANPSQDKLLRSELASASLEADLVVTALGIPMFLDEEYVKEGATVIDIGINNDHGHVHGDVDFTGAAKKAKLITPVPGGIGPMTIAFLFKNVMAIYKHRQ